MKTPTAIAMTDVAAISTLERLLATLLQFGSWLAFAVVAAGIVVYLVPREIGEHFISGMQTGETIVGVGVGLFIALPILRVALTVTFFLHRRDYRFCCFAALVLCIVVCGCVLGVKLGPVGG
jgi:uncharacterized membrane protein